MPTLIIEDGSIVAGANSYLSVADAETILDNQGYSFGAITEDQKQQFLIRSATYLESYRDAYQGYKVSCEQSLQWPRSNVYIDCCAFAANAIPNELKLAQALGAYYESTGKSLQAVTGGQNIASKEVVGAVKVSYFDNGSVDGYTIFTDINNSLDPLLKRSGGLVTFRV